jgi:hypothetical protein
MAKFIYDLGLLSVCWLKSFKFNTTEEINIPGASWNFVLLRVVPPYNNAVPF